MPNVALVYAAGCEMKPESAPETMTEASNETATMEAPLRKTALYALHRDLGAKMVPFAGYSMPLQYASGIRSEHLHTRSRAGLFDISHMGQILVRGMAAEVLETLVCGDIRGLAEYQQRYTLLTNESGGIKDDLMVTRLPTGYFLVVNAANKDAVYDYLDTALAEEFSCEFLADRSLLALQGPAAAGIMEKMGFDPGELNFMQAIDVQLQGIDCMVNRCGYSGEDGFEISVDDKDSSVLAEQLLSHEEVLPVGLGARDSLRLEAGYCLHGKDIDAQTSPVEAGLSWTIARGYRDRPDSAGFPGALRIMREYRDGPERCLRGLRPEGRVPVRDGAMVLDMQGKAVGRVTSGGFGPTLEGPVAMGYVPAALAECGIELQVEIRNRFHTMRVADLPFVKHRYYKR